MRSINPKNRQSILDIAIEHSGDVAAALDICKQNNISLTQIPIHNLQIGDVINAKITQIFIQENYSPATGIAFPTGGIEQYIIGIDAQIID